jgi:hypothetical protein
MLSHTGTALLSIQALLCVARLPVFIFQHSEFIYKKTKAGASAEYGTGIALRKSKDPCHSHRIPYSLSFARN